MLESDYSPYSSYNKGEMGKVVSYFIA